jgi:predicted nucleic acid-binding protein
MTLVDTSVWIEYLRKTDSPTSLRLSELIEEGKELVTTGVIRFEVLAGARSDSVVDSPVAVER